MKKYFITCDLENTTSFSKNITPLATYQISSIRDNVKYLVDDIFNDCKCEIVNYSNIYDYFQSNIKPDEFILSLDNWIYIPNADAFFDSTRVYNSENDITFNPKNYTIKTRDWNELWVQIDEIISKIKLSWKPKVVICDDGIFSWNTINDVINIIKRTWVEVSEIRVILNFSKSDNINWIRVKSMYSDESCKDWLDERDLFYWVKMSWASFYDNWKINWLPYISSQWIAEKKASIPEDFSSEFCEILIEQNINLWQSIREINFKEIQLWDIERIEYLKKYYKKHINIIDLLKQEKQKFSLNQENYDKNNYWYRSLSRWCISNNVCY